MKDNYALFSDWTPWLKLDSLDLSKPGFYVIRSPDDSTSGPKPTPESLLLYVGETCGQTLRQRLNQFNRSAFEQKPAHSGGTRFNELYGAVPSSALLVAVLPVADQEPRKSAFIRYLERAVIWQHVMHHRSAPRCNSK